MITKPSGVWFDIAGALDEESLNHDPESRLARVIHRRIDGTFPGDAVSIHLTKKQLALLNASREANACAEANDSLVCHNAANDESR